MKCPSCGWRPVMVTLNTVIGVVSVCNACGIQGGNSTFLAAVAETIGLEAQWRLDSSKVTADCWRNRVVA